MTRLRIAFLFLAVVAGDYAILRLIYGQLTDFGVAAAVCAVSAIAAVLIAHADHRGRQVVARAREAVWRRRDAQAITGADQQCSSCASCHRNSSESPRFVDRQVSLICRVCAPGIDPGPAR